MMSLQKIMGRYWEGAFLIALIGIQLKRHTRVMLACCSRADEGGYALVLTFELNDVWGNVDLADGGTSCFTADQLEELLGPISVGDVVYAGLDRAELEVDQLLTALTLRQTDCTIRARHTDQGYIFELSLGEKVLQAVDKSGEETAYFFRKPRTSKE